ncbi:MAG: hypothetical protein AAGG02_04530 [Cyanobacteria bacterium P01_H01_bin.15]
MINSDLVKRRSIGLLAGGLTSSSILLSYVSPSLAQLNIFNNRAAFNAATSDTVKQTESFEDAVFFPSNGLLQTLDDGDPANFGTGLNSQTTAIGVGGPSDVIFAPGDIVPGVNFFAPQNFQGGGEDFLLNTFRSSVGGNVYLGMNSSNVALEIIFDTPVTVAGLDLLRFRSDGDVRVDVFTANDFQNPSFSTSLAVNGVTPAWPADPAPTFFGVSSNLADIIRLEIFALGTEDVELIDNVTFDSPSPELPEPVSVVSLSLLGLLVSRKVRNS